MNDFTASDNNENNNSNNINNLLNMNIVEYGMYIGVLASHIHRWNIHGKKR